uniref:Uncharacterized protein n=1 Tax=Chromera velia CCMP2878 TaxID=1169474 RepID=A0A0G4HL92_9ALVE|eukprot:Cvel_7403.t1-p1 / transcript=Cvel_7403.t1 / gene=Cvel_7403 / organism=Chromera_velia_CCMP2878 / gene_product=hypothetical protein / transcript_product=hypothetical protein / location=Cvel_scaffold386:53485-54261(-) / protein_length=259 / sequence_SO=supercontig / SO=protein_coding / is_pseudo=false
MPSFSRLAFLCLSLLACSHAVLFKLNTYKDENKGKTRLNFLLMGFPTRQACAEYYISQIDQAGTNCTTGNVCSGDKLSYMTMSADYPKFCTVKTKDTPKTMPKTMLWAGAFDGGDYEGRMLGLARDFLKNNTLALSVNTKYAGTGRSMTKLLYTSKADCTVDFTKFKIAGCKIVDACVSSGKLFATELVQEQRLTVEDSVGTCSVQNLKELTFTTIVSNAHTAYNLLQDEAEAPDQAIEVVFPAGPLDLPTASPTLLEA